MNITEVRVRKLSGEGKTRGVASIVIDNAFVVKDIRIVEGPKGLFISMPSRRSPDGEFRDVAYPITSEAREEIYAAIMRRFSEGNETQAIR
ncbi:MAG TPA: septation regulator SpoVG [Firmicutes bacterium]|nr:septation regulator SpoVG [Bacillota bacterium]